MIKRHPSTLRLHAYAAGTLDDSLRARVAEHLEGCSQCRRTVADMRELPRAIGRETDAVPSAAVWETIAARVAANDAVLLPAGDAAPPRSTRRAPWIRVAAGILLLLAGAAAAIRSTREAAAEASELSFAPAAPTAGSDVRVAYRTGTLLAGADSVVLRARVLTANTVTSFPVPTVRVGVLRCEGGVCTGSFTLPDSAVYAVFAVENTDASRVDHDGEQWDLMVHDSAGRPLPDALLQRMATVQLRDTREKEQTAQRMTRLYPDNADGWRWMYYSETSNASRARTDSVTAAHRARLRALSSRLHGQSALTAEEVGPLLYYARALEDTATLREWRDWMYRNAPEDRVSAQFRVFDVTDARGTQRLEALERLWAEDGAAAGQIALSGYQFAVSTGDDEALLRWGDRMARQYPVFATVLARASMRRPAIRSAAMERTRRAVRIYDGYGEEWRDLTRTRAEHQRANEDGRGHYLGMLGRALVESGSTRAGLDTLSLAVHATWDPAVFRGAAGARLQLGDTTGALPLLARVAADPATSAAFADTARTWLGPRFDAAAWERELAAGRGELRERILESAVNRPVRGGMRLAGMDGRERTFAASSDSVTLVAFWSRWCVPSKQQLPELQRLATELRRRGVRVITVTSDEPAAEMREFLRAGEFTFPVFFDPDNTARRALQNQGTPDYLLLDRTGRIRFHTYSTDDLLAQADVLRDMGEQRQRSAVTNRD